MQPLFFCGFLLARHQPKGEARKGSFSFLRFARKRLELLEGIANERGTVK